MTQTRRIAVAVVGVALAAYALDVVRDARLRRDAFARPRASYVVTDRDGAVLRVVRPGGVDHRWATLPAISPHLVRAVIAAEDARFERHDGVDARALVRAALAPILPGRRTSGASTIAQQVVKLTHGRERGLRGKLVEIVRAHALVRTRGHDVVLEEYLNRLPFGNGIVGVARASEVYFGKSPLDLSLGEAALLAGIPQAPSVTEPMRHASRARQRRAYVLARLEASGGYTHAEITRAREAPVRIVGSARAYRAPRFVDRVVTRAQADPLSARLATTLDLALQTRGEALLREAVASAEPLGVTNACGVVLDVETGAVRAYVGAAREGGEEEGGELDLLTRPRHPGSTLKSFAYQAFFARGGAPSSAIDDLPREMTGSDGRTYATENFDGLSRGRTTARSALSASLNHAALEVARRVGVEALVATLRAYGFDRVEDADAHGAAVVLGGVSVSPMELARAYLVLARGGTRVAPRFTLEGEATASRVADAPSVALVTDVLSDGRARTEGFGDDLEALAPGAPFALKTGTSPGFRDAWAAVYDARHVVVVWLGDPRGRPTRGATGFRVAAPIAVRWLAAARGHDVRVAPTQARTRVALGTVALCARTGELAGARCPVRYERVGTHPPAARCDGDHHEAPPPLRIVAPTSGATFVVAEGARAPSLRVRVEGEGPFRITLDGDRHGDTITLAPGHHVIVVHDAHGRRAEARFDVTTRLRASLLRVRPRDLLERHAEHRAQPIRRGRDVALRRREADVERGGDLLERELFAVA